MHPHRASLLDSTARRRPLRPWAVVGIALCCAVGLRPVAIPAVGAAGATDALLLTCMDYRLMDDVERYMSGRHLRDRYDHIVLAGASLGAVTEKYPAWNTTFWEHLDIAIKLHDIHSVMVIDHRDCGAYKVIVGPEHAADPKTEAATHAAQLGKLRAKILEKYPQLKVETLLMSLDGTVEAGAPPAP